MSNLREVNFGAAEGLTFEEVRKKFGSEFEQKLLFPTPQTWNLHFPNGESKHDVFKRVDACLQKIAAGAEDNVGVVCHAGVISALQCGYQLKMSAMKIVRCCICNMTATAELLLK